MPVERTADIPGGALAVTTTSQQVLPASFVAQTMYFSNDSPDTVIWLRLDAGPAVAGQGIRLAPAGGQVIVDSYAGAVSAIHANLSNTGTATTGARKSLAYSVI